MRSVGLGRGLLAAGMVAALTVVVPAPAASAAGSARQLPDCGAARMLCAEILDSDEAFGHYVGHDEPELNFYSAQHGSGNNVQYTFTLPKDPA